MCIRTFYYGERSEHFYRTAKKKTFFRGETHIIVVKQTRLFPRSCSGSWKYIYPPAPNSEFRLSTSAANNGFDRRKPCRVSKGPAKWRLNIRDYFMRISTDTTNNNNIYHILQLLLWTSTPHFCEKNCPWSTWFLTI